MSTFACPRCRTKFVIPTRKRQLRERGHVKTLWCWKCKRRTPVVDQFES